MLRVVIVTDSDLSGRFPVGGAETSMALLARRLASRGHEVVLVHMFRDPGLLPRLVREERDGVLTVAIRQMKRSGLERRSHLMKRFRKRVNRRHVSRALRALLIVNPTDVVYTYYQLNAMAWVADTLGSESSTKWMLRIAGLYPVRHIERRASTLPKYQRLIERADCLNYIHSDLQGLFGQEAAGVGLVVPDSPVLIGDIGVDVPSPWLPPAKRRRAGPLRLVMVARFSLHQKRHDVLARAVALMTQPVEVTFVGDGVQRGPTEALVAELALSDRVTFRSQLPQRQLWELLSGFDLLCVVSDYEGLSKITVEAMAIGIPVVASTVAPLTGLLQHERTGFLVDNEPAAWASELDRLALDPSLRDRVATEARSFVEAEYDASKQVILYEEAFSSLMDR